MRYVTKIKECTLNLMLQSENSKNSRNFVLFDRVSKCGNERFGYEQKILDFQALFRFRAN